MCTDLNAYILQVWCVGVRSFMHICNSLVGPPSRQNNACRYVSWAWNFQPRKMQKNQDENYSLHSSTERIQTTVVFLQVLGSETFHTISWTRCCASARYWHYTRNYEIQDGVSGEDEELNDRALHLYVRKPRQQCTTECDIVHARREENRICMTAQTWLQPNSISNECSFGHSRPNHPLHPSNNGGQL